MPHWVCWKGKSYYQVSLFLWVFWKLLRFRL
jgi:hypothetical protein